MVNLRAMLPGEISNRGRLIVSGHYDTKRFTDRTFVGANDGGSSAAFLIELARALKGRRNRLPIELLFFDGEEAVIEWVGNDNTYGSRHYVEVAKRNGSLAGLKALVLLDMIGDRSLNIRRETTSTRWLNDVIWTSAKKLGYTREGEPFNEVGIPHVLMRKAC